MAPTWCTFLWDGEENELNDDADATYPRGAAAPPRLVARLLRGKSTEMVCTSGGRRREEGSERSFGVVRRRRSGERERERERERP